MESPSQPPQQPAMESPIYPDDIKSLDEATTSGFLQMNGGKKGQKRRPKPKDGQILICGVCGDRALGYNFDAISCESCKAFFRRNALKVQSFVCSFEGNCSLDAHSRKFCSGCRLRKCFSIGMKKEWIQDANQLQRRRQRQQNRRHQKQNSTDINLCTTTYGDPLYKEGAMRVLSQPSPIHPCQSTSDSMDKEFSRMSWSDRQQKHPSLTQIPSQSQPPSQRVPPPPAASLDTPTSEPTHSLTSNSFDSTKTTTSVSPLNNGKKDPFDSQNCDGFISKHHCPHPIRTKREFPDDIKEDDYEVKPLNPYIRESLENLCKKYRETFEKPYTAENASKLMTMPKSVDQLYNMTDLFIRRLIRFTKFIPEFKSLGQDDQIGLLKGGIMELFVLRSCMSFDSKTDSFRFRTQVKTESGESVKEGGVNKSIMNTMGSSMFKEHISLIQGLQTLTKQDPVLLILIFVVQLMTPYRPNVKNNQLVAEAQDRHLTWLQAYIRSQYNVAKSTEFFNQLMTKMGEVQMLGKTSCQLLVNINIERLEPILVEIFNLPRLVPVTLTHESN